MFTDTAGREFECQQCGHIVEGHPSGDCVKCGGGHWLSPPSHRVEAKK